jgi:hypothetical protein
VKHPESETAYFRYLAMALLGTFVGLILVSAGCGRSNGGAGGGTYLIPWPDDAGNYQIRPVKIESYDNPGSLKGRFSQVLVNPGVSDRQFQSPEGVGRYVRNSDGQFVPLDAISLQAAAIQAHFERLAKMDAELLAQSHWPARIAVEIGITNSSGQTATNNALYWSDVDALLIPPYIGADVPITVNAGILAHEHFHMIFQHMLLQKVSLPPAGVQQALQLARHGTWLTTSNADSGAVAGAPSPSPSPNPSDAAVVGVYNTFYLSALNEGLADFWGWIYTGDPAFISPSLPQQKDARSLAKPLLGKLDGVAQILARTKDSNGQSLKIEELKRKSYAVGTTYARALRELTIAMSGGEKNLNRKVRMAMAALIIKALPDVVGDFNKSIAAGEMISPNVFFLTLQKHLSVAGVSATAGMCELYQKLDLPECAK